MIRSARARWLVLATLLCTTSGCVQRIIQIDSTPQGALVSLNELEVGRTPMSKEFLWYGDYAVTLRLDGYQTLKTDAPVAAPWWQFIPLDLFTDALPLKDIHRFHFTLKPLPKENPAVVLEHGEQMQQMLEGSRLPRKKPTTARSQ